MKGERTPVKHGPNVTQFRDVPTRQNSDRGAHPNLPGKRDRAPGTHLPANPSHSPPRGTQGRVFPRRSLPQPHVFGEQQPPATGASTGRAASVLPSRFGAGRPAGTGSARWVRGHHVGPARTCGPPWSRGPAARPAPTWHCRWSVRARTGTGPSGPAEARAPGRRPRCLPRGPGPAARYLLALRLQLPGGPRVAAAKQVLVDEGEQLSPAAAVGGHGAARVPRRRDATSASAARPHGERSAGSARGAPRVGGAGGERSVTSRGSARGERRRRSPHGVSHDAPVGDGENGRAGGVHPMRFPHTP